MVPYRDTASGIETLREITPDDDDDPDACDDMECPGHEDLSGPIGHTFYCDGTCT